MLDFLGPDPSQTWEKSTNANLSSLSGNIDGISDRVVSDRTITGGVIPDSKNLESLVGNVDDNLILGMSAIMLRIAVANAPQSREDLGLENYHSTSSIDALTGESLSNRNDENLPISPIVDRAVRSAQGYLSGLATDPDFSAKMNLAFGNSWNADIASNLVQKFASGDFSEIPVIEILPSAAINGANGAFAKLTNTIYLAKEFVEQKAGNLGAITSVVLEETGHFIDSKINVSDAAGDEGDIFGRVVEGKTISAGELRDLKGEDDTAVVTSDGQVFWIEQSTTIPQVSFKTFEKGKYMVAEGGGGSTVNANRDVAGSWETFSLIDLNDGSLNSGDFVNIVTQNGRYMVAEGGGGGVVNANRTAAGPWEKFRVIKVNGSGQIGSGDTIALSASNGQFVVAEGGGGANVNANRNAIGSWEKFTINLSATPIIPSKPDIDIQLFYPNGGFTQSQMNQIEKAAQNWERLITKDKDSSGILKISVVKSPTANSAWFADSYTDSSVNARYNFNSNDVDINGVDYHNNIRFNPSRFSEIVNNNSLVRLAMHEIGHTLGLDHEAGVSLMNHSNFNPQMTNSMYNTLSAKGYNFDPNVPIYWS